MAAFYVVVDVLFATLYWLAGSRAGWRCEGAAGALRRLALFQRANARDDWLRPARPEHSPREHAGRARGSRRPPGVCHPERVAVRALYASDGEDRVQPKRIIAPYDTGWALMFRLVNLRNHDLTDVRAVVSFARWVEENGSRRRRFDLLSLERQSIIFMPLHWVIVHPIDGQSPLRGLSLDSLTAADPEFVCLITADDETFAQTVHSKTSYDKADIVWGARFRDMYTSDVDHVAIDLTRLHDLDRVDGPVMV